MLVNMEICHFEKRRELFIKSWNDGKQRELRLCRKECNNTGSDLLYLESQLQNFGYFWVQCQLSHVASNFDNWLSCLSCRLVDDPIHTTEKTSWKEKSQFEQLFMGSRHYKYNVKEKSAFPVWLYCHVRWVWGKSLLYSMHTFIHHGIHSTIISQLNQLNVPTFFLALQYSSTAFHCMW